MRRVFVTSAVAALLMCASGQVPWPISIRRAMRLLGDVSVQAQMLDTAAIVGRVLDASNLPVRGAVVSASSAELLGGDQVTSTDGTGRYRLGGLPPGSYVLRVVVPGFAPATRTAIVLDADATRSVDVRLEIAGLEQSVAVRAAVSSIDVSTASKVLRLDRLLLENLPTDRNVANIMNLAPGVNGQVAMGGVQQSNPLLLEGVNTSSVQTLGPWVSFNYNWLDEVQVAGLGAGAEVDDFSGAVQRSRLRSGSDEVHVAAEARWTAPGWVDSNTAALSASDRRSVAQQSERILASHDESVDLGGPIVRGRVWAFGGLQASRYDRQPALYDGPDSIDERDRRVLARIDSAPTRAFRAGGFYAYDRLWTRGDGLGPFDPIETTTTDLQPNHTWSANAKWLLGRSMFDLSGGGSGGRLSFDPTAPSTRSGPYPHWDAATNQDTGNVWTYYDFDSRRTVLSAVLRREQSAGGQRHSLDAGVQFERASFYSASGFPGGRAYTDQNGQPFRVALWGGSASEAVVHRAAVFGQDAWTLGPLTLEPGVRVTHNSGLVWQGRVVATVAVAPRFGVAWDVTPRHTTVLSAHIGRYFDALLTPNFAFADQQPQSPYITASVVGPDQFVELSRSTTSSMSIDPNISQPYFDQWLGGVEHAITPALSVNGQAIVRRYRNFMAFVDTGSVYTPVAVQDPGPDGIPGNADDGGSITVFRKANPGNEQYLFTNPAGAYRNYTAAQVIARYRARPGAELQASYTWSRSRGNVENTQRANAGGPELWTNGVYSDPNRAVNNEAPSSFDFTHDVKVLGTWHTTLLGGFAVSWVYRYHSGVSWARSVQSAGGVFVLYGVHVEPRGARQTPALNSVDMRVEKTVSLHRGRLGFLVDGFNVTNQGIPDPSYRRAVYEVSGPSFGAPLNWLPPRSARAAVRVSF